MSKRAFVVMVLSLLAFVAFYLTGCSSWNSTNSDISEDKFVDYTVVLYFANNLYVESGNEEIEKLIKVENITINCKEGNQYFKLVDSSLRQIPEGIENSTTLIDNSIIVNSIYVENGTAYVDLSKENMSGGSMAEAYVISQIVESLISSFEEIEKVQFLIDGENAESLMGHFDISTPFTEGIYNIR